MQLICYGEFVLTQTVPWALVSPVLVVPQHLEALVFLCCPKDFQKDS